MNKKLSSFIAALLLLWVAVPCANALITDPDDYLIYDTGPIAPIGTLPNAPDTFIFNAPGDGVRFIIDSNIVYKDTASTWGRGFKSSEQVAALGWTGFDYTVSTTKLSYIEIPEIEKAPYVFTKLEWKNITKRGSVTIDGKTYTKQDIEPYRWWCNEASSNYNRPSDSIIVRIPAGCDSVFIQAGGTNTGYGIIVYQKDRGFDNGWFNGGNWGMGFNEIGFKPVPNGEDSIDVVIIGSFKDWFTGLNQTRWKDNGSISFQQVSLATALTDYQESERWGQFRKVGINRIKVYGKIEPSVVPPFDGTVAGWDFKYEPKASGTVDLEKPVSTIDPSKTANLKSKYASDLGIKRFMMTTDKGFFVGNDRYYKVAPVAQLMINKQTEKDSLGGYTYYATNYFNFEGKAEGCQELTFNFDFALRKAGTKVVLLGLPIDSTRWEILGEYENTNSQGTSLVSVSQPLPETYTNKSFALRVMVAAGQTYSITQNQSSLLISNVSINGYNDYYAKDEDAPKIAYISNATDRIHIMGNAVTADSTDEFFKTIYTGSDYDVKVFTQEETNGLTNEDTIKAAFKDYKLVILSAYPGTDSEFIRNAKCLVGNRPLLNLNAAVAASWGIGYALQEGNADTLAYLADNSFNGHPVFKDLSLDTVGSKLFLPCIYSKKNSGTQYFQGLDFTSAPQTVRVLANGINDDVNCILEDYTDEGKKHIVVAIPENQNANLNSKATTLLKNAMSYLMSSGYYEAPTFNLTSDGAIVNNTVELQDALAYNYSLIGISNPVIKMNTSTDAGNFYTLGEMKVKNAVTLQPNDGAEVTFNGTFIPVSTNVGSLTFKKVNFTAANPFLLAGKQQKFTKGLFFDECVFTGLSSIVSTSGSDSCQIDAVSVKNCTITAQAEGALIDVKDCFQLDSIYFGENYVKSSQPKQLISWTGTHPNDSSTVAMLIDHNQFMSQTSAPAADFISYSMTTQEEGYAALTNNIFYRQGTASLTLPRTVFTEAQALNNLAIETTADWQAVMDTVSMLTLEDLGLEDPFAAGLDAKVVRNSPLYRAGTSRSYVGPKSLYIDRSVAETILVKNFNELHDALEIAIDKDIIELADYEMSETDSINAYVLTGLVLPTNGASIVIRNAEGATPKVIGNILGSSAAKLYNLTISGLTWIVNDSLANYASDTYTAAFINTKNYTILGTLSFINCTFKDQEKPIFRMKGKDATDGSYIGKLVFKGCTIDNHGGKVLDGESGGHLIQLDKAEVYTFNNFEFTQNYVTNFHGGQVFNLSRLGSADEYDKAIKYDISNNLFYYFGGAAKSARNFLEFNQTPALCSVDINIANNLFYERYSTEGYPVAYIDLYASGTQLSNKVLVANNFYFGKYYTGETGKDNPVSADTSVDSGDYNLKQKNDNGSIVVTYEEQLYSDLLGGAEVFEEGEELRISTTSPLYTAGKQGTCIGPERLYTGMPVGNEKVSGKYGQLAVASCNGMIRLATDEQEAQAEIFNVLGQSIAKLQVRQGVNEIDGLTVGQMYIVRVGDAVAKIIVR